MELKVRWHIIFGKVAIWRLFTSWKSIKYLNKIKITSLYFCPFILEINSQKIFLETCGYLNAPKFVSEFLLFYEF